MLALRWSRRSCVRDTRVVVVRFWGSKRKGCDRGVELRVGVEESAMDSAGASARVGLLIPTYNNAGTIGAVVESVRVYGLPVVVVNDGSTDGADEILAGLPGGDDLTVLGYGENCGKGYALRYGMRYAYEAGWEYVLTLDGDGQHEPEDVPLFLEALEEVDDGKPVLLVGQRDFSSVGISRGSLFANRFSSFWYRLETGVRLADTQSGLRLYPLQPVVSRSWMSNGYAFELEALVRLQWGGVLVRPVPMRVYYPPASERVSHFRPVPDFIRISLFHSLFTIVGLLFVRPYRWLDRVVREDFRQAIRSITAAAPDQIKTVSLSVGYGVMCSVLPIWGYQMLFAATTAHFFNLNRLVVVLFSYFSLPPLIPFIVYLSVRMGCWILGSSWDGLRIGDFSWSWIRDHLAAYVVGSLSLAVLLGLISFGLSYLFLNLRVRRGHGSSAG